MCLLTIVAWTVMSLWPKPTHGVNDAFVRGIGDEFGRMHLARDANDCRLAVNFIERVTINTSVRLGADGPFVGRPDKINFALDVPVKGLQPRPPRFWMRNGYSFAILIHPSFDLVRGFSDQTSGVTRQMKRTGLTEEEVYKMAALARWSITLTIPLWLLVIVSGAYPLIVVAFRGRMRRRRRRKRGLCVHCGYNLQGNVSGVCSECGRGIEQGKKGAIEQRASGRKVHVDHGPQAGDGS